MKTKQINDFVVNVIIKTNTVKGGYSTATDKISNDVKI